jgi:cytochrome bd-type quinol oxidase subunit 2
MCSIATEDAAYGTGGVFLGSTVVAFVQGAAVGAMIRGIPVVNEQYAGGSFDWVAPLPVFCGIGLVFGYALLGASWIVLKTEGALRDWAWLKVPHLAGTVLVVLALATVASIVERDRIIGAVFLAACVGPGVSGDRPAGDIRHLRRYASASRWLPPSQCLRCCSGPT